MDIFGYKIQSPFVSKDSQTLVTKSYTTGSLLLDNSFISPDQLQEYYQRTGISFMDMDNLSKIYHSNPIINAALNVNARYLSNVEVRVKDLSTGIIYSKLDVRRGKINNKVVEKMFNLINEPNPLQSTDEFLKFLSITHDIHGNSMIKGNFIFDKIDIEYIQTMFCLWPQFAKPIMSKKNYWNQIDIKGIIDHWEYTMLGATENFSTDEILHRKESNTDVGRIEDLVLGKSKLTALKKVISTINASYDARETVANERGAKAIISPDKNDPFMGKSDLTPKERKVLEAILQKKYGLKSNQSQHYISDVPVSVFQFDQDVRKLGIVEEIGLDTMITAHIYDIPPELIKMYKEGATYENQASNERIMYESNAKIRANSIFNDLNNWLNVRKHGYEYVTSWDHISVLQADKKETSLIARNMSFVCREMFLASGMTMNEWRVKQGWEETDNPLDNIRLADMTPEQQQVITGRTLIQAQNENPQTPDSSSQI